MDYTKLHKDVWLYITKFLTKNDIACLMTTCKQINRWFNNYPKLTVYNVPSSEFWSSVIEVISEDQSNDYCISIEDIDRGVKSFVEFSDKLVEAYPNMTELSFSQNYSYRDNGNGQNIDSKQWQDEFIYFVTRTNLSYLKIEDCQSGFFANINWDNILKLMPPRSEYIIIFDTQECDIFNNYVDYRDFLDRDCFQVKTVGNKRIVLHSH